MRLALVLALVCLSLPVAIQAAAPPMAAVVTQTVVVARIVPEGDELHPAWAASVFSGRQLPSLAEDAPIQPPDIETSAGRLFDELFKQTHPLYRIPEPLPGLEFHAG